MTEKLKPCPFCGGKADIRTLPSKNNRITSYFPMCRKCMTTGDNYASYEAAAKAWNRRTNESE